MTLVELSRLWKDGKISDEGVQEAFEKIEIYTPESVDGEVFWTRGDDNAWLDIVADDYLNREERIEFKKIVGLIEWDNNKNIL